MVFRDHYAYVSGWTGVTVLDIAQADSPRLVGELPLPHFENEDVDACGDMLIVVTTAPSRPRLDLYVVDIANPTVPTVRAVQPSVSWRHGTRIGTHRELREDRLHAGLGGRWQPGRGR